MLLPKLNILRFPSNYAEIKFRHSLRRVYDEVNTTVLRKAACIDADFLILRQVKLAAGFLFRFLHLEHLQINRVMGIDKLLRRDAISLPDFLQCFRDRNHPYECRLPCRPYNHLVDQQSEPGVSLMNIRFVAFENERYPNPVHERHGPRIERVYQVYRILFYCP